MSVTITSQIIMCGNSCCRKVIRLVQHVAGVEQEHGRQGLVAAQGHRPPHVRAYSKPRVDSTQTCLIHKPFSGLDCRMCAMIAVFEAHRL